MFTRDERRALVFLAATAALGGAVRAVRASADSPPGAALVAPDLAVGDVQAQGAKARRAVAMARPLQPGERVDVDRADALEIERLPRVGPGLARRIVDDRAAKGPFGSLQGLGRVPGVGVGNPARPRASGELLGGSCASRRGAPAGRSAACPERCASGIPPGRGHAVAGGAACLRHADFCAACRASRHTPAPPRVPDPTHLDQYGRRRRTGLPSGHRTRHRGADCDMAH